jgi:hypothetical protein
MITVSCILSWKLSVGGDTSIFDGRTGMNTLGNCVLVTLKGDCLITHQTLSIALECVGLNSRFTIPRLSILPVFRVWNIEKEI